MARIATHASSETVISSRWRAGETLLRAGDADVELIVGGLLASERRDDVRDDERAVLLRHPPELPGGVQRSGGRLRVHERNEGRTGMLAKRAFELTGVDGLVVGHFDLHELGSKSRSQRPNHFP